MQQVLRSKGKYINWVLWNLHCFSMELIYDLGISLLLPLGATVARVVYVILASALTLFSVLDDFGGI